MPDIDRRRAPSPDTFYAQYVAAKQPVVLTGEVNRWPAFSRWTMEWFGRCFGNQSVPVHYTSPGFEPQAYFANPEAYSQESGEQMVLVDMPLSQFLAEITGHSKELPPGTYSLVSVPLACIGRRLRDDLRIPEYLSVHGSTDIEQRLWLGPAGKYWTLHVDLVHGYLAQVTGQKHVLMVSHEESGSVYPHPQNPHISLIPDVAAVDPACFPQFQDVTVYECILNSGELLYIPSGWWHQVRYLSTSIAVSLWPVSKPKQSAA